jgi:hypothetical protein
MQMTAVAMARRPKDEEVVIGTGVQFHPHVMVTSGANPVPETSTDQ